MGRREVASRAAATRGATESPLLRCLDETGIIKIVYRTGVRRFKPPPFYHSSAKGIRDDITLRIYFILLESSLERLPAPVQTKTCQHSYGSFEHSGVDEKIKPDVR
jgi:hypothetical protein